jgi:DNA polymerase-3 subunit delta
MAQIAAMKDAPGRLVLVAHGLDVARTGELTSPFDAAKALFARIAEAGGLCACIPPFERDLKGGLVKSASAQGVQLSPAAADALIEIVGTDQMALHEELAKLVTNAGNAKRISPEDVRELAAMRGEGNAFTLAERILDGDLAAAMSILASLREVAATRSSAYILASLATSFRRYLSSAGEVERGAGARQAAAKAGVPYYVQEAFARRLERWDARALTALLDRALQCDIEVKTGSVGEEVALETFVIDACGGHLQSRELVGRWLYEV